MITLQRLKEIVEEASQLMKEADFQIVQKGGYANIVTSTDLRVQDLLRQRLDEALPGSGFICEEEDRHDPNHQSVWIIDPIDGTANFSRGIDQCAISVGLRHRGETLMGVVYVPRTGEMFSAQRGCGAWLGEKQISVSDRCFANSIMCTALPAYYKEHAPECGRIITAVFQECNDLRRFGAAAPEICYLAAGRCELYFEYCLSAWDFAAASLILEEAGGALCDSLGMPLDPTRKSSVLAANNQENLQKLLSFVKPVLNPRS